MATIVKRFITGYDVEAIYVVGGACSFTEFESVFEKFYTFLYGSPMIAFL